jgi:integrase/recombinase XerD
MTEPAQSRSERVEQPSLFLPGTESGNVSAAPPAPLVRSAPLSPQSALGTCALAYQEHLRITDHSTYTITCFLSDLRLLTEYLGRETRLREVTAKRLGEWLNHLRWERETKPAPKTMARRVTFLKNFCGWLAAEHILPSDPSERVALTRPTPPLPELLFDDEVERLERAAAVDVRCHLLVLLVLRAGLKREEVMGLRPGHVDLSDPAHPAVEVHFPGQAKRRRERRMELPAEWTPVYLHYVECFQPREHVFECTERNVNYVLASAVRRAGITKRVTLQLLRDIYAVRQLRAGVAPQTVREQLGLSEEAWYESAEKYQKLAFPA